MSAGVGAADSSSLCALANDIDGVRDGGDGEDRMFCGDRDFSLRGELSSNLAAAITSADRDKDFDREFRDEPFDDVVDDVDVVDVDVDDDDVGDITSGEDSRILLPTRLVLCGDEDNDDDNDFVAERPDVGEADLDVDEPLVVASGDDAIFAPPAPAPAEDDEAIRLDAGVEYARGLIDNRLLPCDDGVIADCACGIGAGVDGAGTLSFDDCFESFAFYFFWEEYYFIFGN